MNKSRVYCLLLAFVCWFSTTRTVAGKSKDRIRLSEVQVLTLTQGKWTAGRRTRPVPQLQCVGGTARCAFIPDTIQCYNKGSDGVDIQWQCKAEMDARHRFGQLEVTCEGYDYPEDDYVLVGSCGLEYSIDVVKPDSDSSSSHFKQQSGGYSQKDNSFKRPSEGTSLVLIIVIVAGMGLVYYTCLRQPNEAPDGRRTSSSAPPPPAPGFRSEYSDGSNCDSSSERTPRSSSRSSFWPGFGLGGVLGYFLGNRSSGTNYADQSSYFSRTNRRREDSPFSGHSSGFSSSPSPSSTPRTATGFGGTKRR